MQQFKEKLSKLVGSYQNSGDIKLQALESDFIQLVAETLSAPPLTEESINQISKRLFLPFHPDKAGSFSPDVQWLESVLSEGRNDGACFKIIGLCKERLIASNNPQGETFEKAENIGDLKATFIKLRNKSSTHIQRAFYDSLITFIDECTAYNNKIEKIQYRQLQLAMKFLPLYTPHLLISIFQAEIIALYTVSALSALLGYTLQKSGEKSLQAFGENMKAGGVTGLSGTSIALVRVYEMSYWFCGNSYDLALQAGSNLIKTINPPDTRYFFHEFHSEAIQQVARPFLTYLKKNEQQYFREARLGSTKRQVVLQLLENAKNIDNQPVNEESKMEKLKSSIDVLAKIDNLNTGSLAMTIKEAYRLIDDQKKPLLLSL